MLGLRGLTGAFPVEEEDVGFDALGIENAGGKPEQGMHVTFMEQSPPHRLTSSTFAGCFLLLQHHGAITIPITGYPALPLHSTR